MPEVGDKAPDFTAPIPGRQRITLSQYQGNKNVVLAFYVADFTGG